MKQKILKSFLCLSLSAAMIFGEAGGAFATTIADTPEVEAVVQTQTVDEPEMTEEGEAAAEETAVDELAEGETVEAAPEEETTETEETTEEEAAQAEATTEEAAEGEAQQEETDDVLEALGAKIVSPTVLADVGGYTYDAQKKVLSWNKVAGATAYKYEISYVDEDGNAGSYGYSGTISSLYYDFSDFSIPGRVYTVKISAINKNELYVVAANVAVKWGSEYDETAKRWKYGYCDLNSGKLLYEEGKDYDVYDRKETPSTSGTTTTYTLYKYPASAKQTEYRVTPWTTAEANAETDSVTALTGVALVELRGEFAAFKVTPAEVKDYEMVYYSYSNNEAFRNDGDQLYASSEYSRSNSDLEFSINSSQFFPGETIYVKARTYNSKYDYKSKPGQTSENRYSAPVTTTYTVPKAKMASVDTTVTGSSVRLEPLATKAKVTGFEYQRKNGKKWITIAKQGSAYTDEGLKEGTKYTYRVRGYSYNAITKKTTYTAWKQVNAYTWGAALNLKASAASATSIKLKWSKIPKADGYEIYRYDTISDGYSYAKGDCKDDFDNAALIKTIKKAKTASYTDKKLTKGNSYKYLVRAYRTIGKNKCYIEDEVDITLSAEGSISDLKVYYNASGNPVVTWDKATGISGYKVEKGNPATGKWEAYKELGKTATTITLPSLSPGSASVKYRIRSYNGDTIYKTWTVTVAPTLPAVKNVKAVQTPEGVQVTWSPVAGADYYEVFRTTKEAGSYNETIKLYGSVDSYSNVVEAAYDVSSSTDLAKKGESQGLSAKSYEYNPNLKRYGTYLYNGTTSYSTAEIKGTSVVDKQITVQQLIRKEDDPAYNKAADPERYTDSNGIDRYEGAYGTYAKNADGSLKTRTVAMVKGPEAGNTYYYYVRACTKASNGANKNYNTTYSAGYTKGAQVTYTAKKAKATKLSSAKSTKKATVVVSAKKVKGAKGYAFYRSTKKKGTYVRVGTSKKTKYTDTNVTGGKTYYYKTASYTITENGTFVYSKLSAPKKVKAKK